MAPLAEVPKVTEQARVALWTTAGVELLVEPKFAHGHILLLPAGGTECLKQSHSFFRYTCFLQKGHVMMFMQR